MATNGNPLYVTTLASGVPIPGPVGPRGAQGPTGSTGAQGPTGATGPIGMTGAMGPMGPTGGQGPVGPQGPRGQAGPQGPQGNPSTALQLVGVVQNSTDLPTPVDPGTCYYVVGTNSVWGFDGVQWIDLGPLQGAAGPPGPQGNPGPTGLQGVPGQAGPTGANGATGPQGPTGPAGPQGSGIQVLGVVSTPAALPATGNANGNVYFVNSNGHLYVWGLGTWNDMGLASGPPGATGSTGPQGPTGPTGPPGQQTPWLSDIDGNNFRLMSPSRILINTYTDDGVSALQIAGRISIENNQAIPSGDFPTTQVSSHVYSGSAYNLGGDFLACSARGTMLAPGISQGGDWLGGFKCQGWDGSQWTGAGAVRVLATGVWSPGNAFGDLQFLTNNGGSPNLTERMRITAAGNVGIGTQTPQVSLDIVGQYTGSFSQGGHAGPVTITATPSPFDGQNVNYLTLNTQGSPAYVAIMFEAGGVYGAEIGYWSANHQLQFWEQVGQTVPSMVLNMSEQNNSLMGINVNTPQAVLDIAGKGYSTGLGHLVHLLSTAPNGRCYLLMDSQLSGGSANTGIELYTGGTWIADIYADLTGLTVEVGPSLSSIFVSAANGYVGIQKANAQYPLDVNGDINITGSIRRNGAVIL